MKYGVQLYSLRKYLKDEKGYERIFHILKDMGAEVVQLSSTQSKPIDSTFLANLVKESGITICGTHSPFNRIVSDLDNLAKEHLEFGCDEIGIGMMPREYKANNFSKLDEFISILNTTSNKLKEYGITLAYHNHWFEFQDIGGTTPLQRILNETDCNIIPDTFWMKFAGEEPTEYLKKLDGRVKTVHLKDYKKTLGIPVFRSLGKGILDFKSILDISKDIKAENAVIELDLAPRPIKSIEGSMKYLKENF